MMNPILMAFLTVASMSLSANVVAAHYKIDPDHSFVVFKISHIGISTTVGQFPGLSGDFTYDPADVSRNTVNASVEIGRVDTHHAERDKHLRGEAFFNVKKFPKATFSATQYQGTLDKGTLSGTLTLMGVQKPIEVNVVKVGEGADPWGGYRVGFTGTFQLNRQDFNMGHHLDPNSVDIEMDVFIEGVRS